MTEQERQRVTVAVSDAALAALVARAATSTPGVMRLQPRPLQAARDAITSTVTRAGELLADRVGGDSGADRLGPEAIRTAGVDIERDAATGTVTATARVVVSTDPPVQQTVEQLQRRIADELSTIAQVDALVVVKVIDVEPHR